MIEISKINIAELSQTDWSDISTLIYGTDEHIYPATFEDVENAKVILPDLIRKSEGVFSHENIRIAIKDGKIVGIIVFSHNGTLSLGFKKEQYPNLPVALHDFDFDDVNERYYKAIQEHEGKQDLIYAVAICVDKNHRKQKVGSMLLQQLISEHDDKDILLDILADNVESILLCKSHGFVEEGEQFPDYARGKDENGEGNTLPCQTMLRKRTRIAGANT
jgi:ribosomal protein S18 acetylase RimI-like enzyme